MMKRCLSKNEAPADALEKESPYSRRNSSFLHGKDIHDSWDHKNGIYKSPKLQDAEKRKLVADDICEWLSNEKYLDGYDLRFSKTKYTEIVNDWLQDEADRFLYWQKEPSRMSYSTLDCNHTHFVLVDNGK